MPQTKATCDVLVVGGGPAGSSVAAALVRAGMDVVIMDKSPFPRHKVCAGWITPAVVDELGIDTGAYAERHTLQPITGFDIGVIGASRQVGGRYGRAVSYGIRRCEFDHYLLTRAGARLLLGEALRSLIHRNGVWEVNGGLHTPMIVGAGGHFCPVARALGNGLGRGEKVVAAQEIEFRMTAEQRARCRVEGEVPELYFCRDLKGYGWCFRKGEFLNVGLGREDNRRLADHVDAFHEYLLHRGRIPRDAARFKGHAYLLYGSGRRSIVHDGALLVGDAAGLAYSQSGEGIRPAVESALMAADTIVGANGEYARHCLASYEGRIEARFGSRAGSPVDGLIPARLKQALGRRLIANRWFSRRVVLEKWFLHTDQPPLAAGGGGEPGPAIPPATAAPAE